MGTCDFCNINKSEYKTDDNYNLCPFCYLKITKICSKCGKRVVNIFSSTEGKYYCDNCAREKDELNYYFLKALSGLGNYEEN